MQRLLRPGGTLILNFDAGHAPTATEPHALTADVVRAALRDMTVTAEHTSAGAHGVGGDVVVMVAERR